MTELSTMAEAVKARLDQAYPVQLRLPEIAQATQLDRSSVMDALLELEDRGLAEPVEWRAVRPVEVGQ